jgi:hypothetical protein
MAHLPKVIIRGFVLKYEEKAPYGKSGVSIGGALELTEDERFVKCHECGGFYEKIGLHSNAAHGISAREYKKIHGLQVRTGLCSPIYSARLRAIIGPRLSSPEYCGATAERNKQRRGQPRVPRGKLSTLEGLNLKSKCPDQLKAEMRKIAKIFKDLGRQPTHGEMMRLLGVRVDRFSAAEVVEICGFDGPYPGGRPSVCFTKTVLIELLRDAYVAKRSPLKSSDCGSFMLPAFATFVRHFGSWTQALIEAGLGLTSIVRNYRKQQAAVAQ